MRKMIIGTGCFVVVALLISFVILPSVSRAAGPELPLSNSETVESVSSLPASQAPVSSSPSLVYIVKSHEGNIAVFEEGSQQPFRICNVSVSILPKEDQQLLKEGIKAYSQAELTQILEDYCS